MLMAAVVWVVESAKFKLVVVVVVALAFVALTVVTVAVVALTFPVVVMLPAPKLKLPDPSVTGITLFPPVADVFMLSKRSTLRLATLVVEVTASGGVPVKAVEVKVEAETELAVIDPVVVMEMSDLRSVPVMVPSTIEAELTLAVSMMPEVLTEKMELSLLFKILNGDAD